MNIEEAKKIIQNKIQADEAARQVRSQIKTYIHEKQNVREGFKETFKPLIETSEKVKESVDTQQNKLIKQLQENQLALTQGLEGNRLAITSGFDKMDEVNKWELDQIPDLESIEKPEEDDKEEDLEPITYLITKNDLKLLEGEDESKLTKEGDELIEIEKNILFEILTRTKLNLDKYNFKKNTINPGYTIFEIFEREEKKPKGLLEISDDFFNEGINYTEATDFLKDKELPLPKSVKGENIEKIENYQKKTESLLKEYDEILRNKKKLTPKKGKHFFKAKSEKPLPQTLKEIKIIKEYNILINYYKKISELIEYKEREKKGKGIIHFNNPQQLVSRLELLAGSIIAGNNGAKQELSQIAHLLHQLKVINKKTLSDLLKIYILFK